MNKKNKIISLTVANFYSFMSRETVIFDAKTPAYMVVGHNASGKTSLLKAMSFLKWLLLFSFDGKKDQEFIPCDNFAFSKNSKLSPIELSVEYFSSGNKYLYTVSLSDRRVLYEKLSQRIKLQKNNTWLTLFSRKWLESKRKYKIDSKNFDLSEEIISGLGHVSGSLLAVTRNLNTHVPTNEALNFWKNLISNVIYNGKGTTSIEAAAKEYFTNPALLKKAVGYLKSFDLGLQDIKLRKITSEEKNTDDRIMPTFIHTNSESSWELPYILESEGTQSLFKLLVDLIPVLESGGLAILDEIDNDLHPLMMEKIIELFLSKKTNPNEAGIIFASHNADFLRRLEKESIIFVEKDNDLSSHVWKLSEMSGIRRFENYTAKYLSGAYGAIIRERNTDDQDN